MSTTRQHYYYNSIRKQTIQFIDLFNDIKIERNDKDGNLLHYITVPIKFAPKSKTYLWVNERKKKEDKYLPVIGIELSSVLFDETRLSGKYEKIYVDRDDSLGTLRYFYNVIPYNFGFKMTIVSEYMDDVNQILEQILPFFSPMVHVKLHIPELGMNDETDLDLKILIQSVTPEVVADIPTESYRDIVYNIDFLMQGFVFLPMMEENTNKVVQLNLKSNTLGTECSPSGETLQRQNYIGLDYDLYNGVVPSAGVQVDNDIQVMWKLEILNGDNL